MNLDDKRRLRREKKAVKREGTKRARRALARGLREHPHEAQFDEVDFGMARSQPLNGRERRRPDDDDSDAPLEAPDP
jgi:hypothetical protein